MCYNRAALFGQPGPPRRATAIVGKSHLTLASGHRTSQLCCITPLSMGGCAADCGVFRPGHQSELSPLLRIRGIITSIGIYWPFDCRGAPSRLLLAPAPPPSRLLLPLLVPLPPAPTHCSRCSCPSRLPPWPTVHRSIVVCLTAHQQLLIITHIPPHQLILLLVLPRPPSPSPPDLPPALVGTPRTLAPRLHAPSFYPVPAVVLSTSPHPASSNPETSLPVSTQML
ncbi:hypothetical protein B0H11DRAFT_2229537 [Mycena galericulata]|nr:hypothetical protein B0H11DRAFT_2229537 [Mycena galericulata]